MSPKKSVGRKSVKASAAPKKATPARRRSSPVKKSRPAASAKPSASAKPEASAKSAASAKTDRRAASGKKAAPKPQVRAKKKTPRRAAPASKGARTDKTPGNKARLVEPAERKGLGAAAAGQSGDVEGLSSIADADSESVTELVEEGQAYEAEVVSGVERASDAEEQEVTTEEVSEDDIPPEYGGSE
jgi:hypothetical protein